MEEMINDDLKGKTTVKIILTITTLLLIYCHANGGEMGYIGTREKLPSCVDKDGYLVTKGTDEICDLMYDLRNRCIDKSGYRVPENKDIFCDSVFDSRWRCYKDPDWLLCHPLLSARKK